MTIKNDDPGTFKFRGHILPYCHGSYNNAANNERSVEVPIALKLYNTVRCHGGKVLEIGAVLPHYMQWESVDTVSGERIHSVFPHLVVDKYEKYPGVINQDIRKWEPPRKEKYDLIISLSTLEHIFDRGGYRDSDKLDITIDLIGEIESWLAKDGVMLITFPWGQPYSIGGGDYIDEYIESCIRLIGDRSNASKTVPDKIYKLKRLGFGVAGNRWVESDVFHGPSLGYHVGVPSAGTVFTLIWGNFERIWR